MFHYVACGLSNIWLENGYRITKLPNGSESFEIDHIKELHDAIGNSLIQKSSILNGDEFRFIRSEMRLSRKSLGELLGRSDEAIKKWESGENPIPKAEDTILRKLYSEHQRKEDKTVKELVSLINQHEKREAKELCFIEKDSQWEQESKCA